jgi:chorismate mutase
MSLDEMRDEIQKIDGELLKLLERRTAVVQMVGDYKKERNLPIYAPEVEKKKIEALSAACSYPGLVETIWPVVMCYSRSVE